MVTVWRIRVLDLDALSAARVWYLLYFGSLVCVGPYLNVFFVGKGLSNAQLGLISALRPWLAAPASFAWSALADWLCVHKQVLISTFIISTLGRTLLLLPDHFLGILGLILAVELFTAPVGVMSDAAVVAACHKESDYGKYRLWGAVGWGIMSSVAGLVIHYNGMPSAFYLQLALAAPCLCFAGQLYNTPAHHAAPASPTGPAVVAAKCDEAGVGAVVEGASASLAAASANIHERHRHSPDPMASQEQEQRPSGGAGRGCRDNRSNSDNGSSHGSDDHEAQQQQQPLLQRLQPAGVAPAHQQRKGTVHGSGRAAHQLFPGRAQGRSAALGADALNNDREAGDAHWAQLLALLRKPDVLLFFWTTCIMGVGFGAIDVFLFVYLKDLGASEALMGLTLTVTCAAEVPVFQLQDRLIDRIGVPAVLDMVLAAYALRMLCYALLPYMGSVWAVLPIETLHGVTFACGWGAGTVNCKLLAPKGLAATMQGAFQSLYFGLGYGLGALVGGYLAQRFGLQLLFASASCAMAVLLVLGWLARRIIAVHHPPRPTGSAAADYVQLSAAELRICADGLELDDVRVAPFPNL